MVETEQLKKEYMQSQLLGLKSQVNPHFLFNSLNSLSSLISENQQEAEKFLDEMSKVYRYLLRNSDDQLVTLDTELQFVRSYFYLLKARYSDGIRLSLQVSEDFLYKSLPPLTIQMLVEAAYNQNTVSKDRPLHIEIRSLESGWLQIKNNIEKKVADENVDLSGLENVANKFRLLCQQNIVINKTAEHHTIELPLISQTEKQLA
jgi:LytS/YehU family sensor histidine kinase